MKRLYTLILFACFLMINTAPISAQTALPNINCAIFPSNHIFNTRLDTLLASGHISTDSRSNTWLNNMGRTRTLRPDFGEAVWPEGTDQIIGIPYNVVTNSQPKVGVNYYLYGADSDPGPMPIPPTALREGGPSVTSGDRHVLVVDDTNCVLYELWYAYKNPNNTWEAGSGAVFDLMSNWLRPNGWTSADAAGLPILPFLPRYQDILAGEMRHAVRFTLPSTARSFVWPAIHAAGSQNISDYPPMGQIFLLNPNFDISQMSPAGQIIATAMKRYGIILADNGSAGYVSGTHDPRWNINALKNDLGRITFNDFVAVDICKLRVNQHSGEAGVNANPSGTGCTYPQNTSTSGGYAQGRVFDPLGNPIAGVTVSASSFGSRLTDATGTYLITGIPRNQNFVLSANGTSIGLTTQWWLNSDTLGGATTIQLTSSISSAYQRNFTLGEIGEVTGTVYASNGTTPLPNVPIRVDGRSEVVCTNGSGQFTLTLIKNVPYKIGAGGNHANCTDKNQVLRWYPNAYSPQTGQSVIPDASISFTLPDTVTYEMNEQLFLHELQVVATSTSAPIYPILVDVVANGAVITFIRPDNTTGTATLIFTPDGGALRMHISQTTGQFGDTIRAELPQMVMTAFDTVLGRANLADNRVEGMTLTMATVIFVMLDD